MSVLRSLDLRLTEAEIFSSFDVLYAPLQNTLRRTLKYLPNRLIVLEGSKSDGIEFIARWIKGTIASRGRVVVASNLAELKSLVREVPSDPVFLVHKVLGTLGSEDLLILDISESASGLLPLIPIFYAGVSASPGRILLIGHAEEELVAVRALRVGLSDFRVTKDSAYGFVAQIPEAQDFEANLVYGLIEEPIPVLFFLHWLAHVRDVAQLLDAFEWSQFSDPEAVRSSGMSRPSYRLSPELWGIKTAARYLRNLSYLMEVIGKGEKNLPTVRVESNLSSRFGLTSKDSVDVHALAELLTIAEDLELIVIDRERRQIRGSPAPLSLSKTAAPREVPRMVVFQAFADLALLEGSPEIIALTQEAVSLDVTRDASSVLRTELRDLDLTDEQINVFREWFKLEDEEREVLVLEALREWQSTLSSSLDQRPMEFLREIAGEGSERLAQMRSRLQLSGFESLFPSLRRSLWAESKFPSYYLRAYRRLLSVLPQAVDLASTYERLQGLTLTSQEFSHEDVYLLEVYDTTEYLIDRLDSDLAESAESKYFETLGLAQIAISLLLQRGKVGFQERIVERGYALGILPSKLLELKKVRPENTRRALDRYTNLWAQSQDLFISSERFMEGVLNLEREFSRILWENYRLNLTSSGFTLVKNFVLWLLGVEESPPPQFEQEADVCRDWKELEGSGKSVFLFVLDGFSYKFLKSWQERVSGPKKELFDQTFATVRPLFASLPTLTAPGHISILSGKGPEEHGITDNRLVRRHGSQVSVEDTNDWVTPEDVRVPRHDFLGKQVAPPAKSVILNRYLRPLPRGTGTLKSRTLTSVIGLGMKIPHGVTALPALYAELAKLPSKTDRTMLYLVQLPELDRYAHQESIERFGSPKEIISEQIHDQYDRFMDAFLSRLRTLKENARRRSIPSIFLVVADHGMDLCLKPTTDQHEMLSQLGVRLSRGKGESGEPGYLPGGAYPAHIASEDRSRDMRVGIAVPATASGKLTSFYLLGDPESVFRYSISCGCGSSFTLTNVFSERERCPNCKEVYEVQDKLNFEAALDSVRSLDYSDVWLADQSWIGGKDSLPDRIEPSFRIFAQPGVFLLARHRHLDQELFESLSPLLDSGDWTPIEKLQEASQVSPKKLQGFLDRYMGLGYLEGSKRVEASARRISHVRKRSTPLIGVLSHGSCSIGESYVPFLCGVT